MDLVQHFNASINSVSSRHKRKINKTDLRQGVFLSIIYSTELFHLEYRPMEYQQ